MTDLVSDSPATAQSPKRKFSFRFPNLSHHGSMDKDNHIGSPSMSNGSASHTNTLTYMGSGKNRNFSEEIKNVPDLQVIYLLFVLISASELPFI